MRVAIDAHRLVYEPHTSGATYLTALLEGWRELGLVDHFVLLLPGEAPGSPAVEGFETVSADSGSDPSSSLRRQLFWNQVLLPRLVRRTGADVFFSPFHLTPIAVRGPVVTTIHDLCFLNDPAGRGRLVHRLYLESALRRATRTIVVSAFTREQLASFRPRAVESSRCIYNAVTSKTLSDQEADRVLEAARFETGEPFIVWIGSFSPRKNPRLAKSVGDHLPLRTVAVVPHGHADRAGEWFGAENVLVGLTPAHRDALLRKARLLLAPSACEGFGYPVAESMRQGCPVVTLHGGATAELLGGLVPSADTSERSMIETCEQVLGSTAEQRDDLARSLIARSNDLFSPRRMASDTYAVFEDATRSRR
ncbi:MAG TPA: glycosyltransferase [Actinomycetota bacterium]|nr:glycosyltransferase [Actinomycetota bacterium]